MTYDTEKWGTLFPATIGNETRPTDAIDNTFSFATDQFPQFISSDPVKWTLQNAFLKQLFSNDQRIKEITDNIKSGYLPLTGGTMTGALILYGPPTADLHSTTKKYVDDADKTKLSLTGGTMTGAITLPSDPTENLQATTKQYVNTEDDKKLSLTGGTMTGAITLPSDPTANLQAATKQYVDKLVNIVYPVGAIYWSSVATSPQILFGIGTWEQIKDEFILAAGDIYEAGTTAGEAAHILTEAELPTITPEGTITNAPHSHGYKKNHIQWNGDDNPADNGTAIGNKDVDGTTEPATVISTFKGTSFGSGQAHNNMPPYVVAYCWKRIA